MKLKIIIVLIALLTINVCSASSNDTLNDIINTSENVDDWRNYENFNGNVQLYIDGEPYYLTVENKSIDYYNGETNDFKYEVFTTNEDLKNANNLLKTYSENDKLGIFDSLKAFWLLQKTPIYHDSQTVKISNKIGMAITW